MLMELGREASRTRRRLHTRWAVIAALGGGVFGLTVPEGAGMAVTATVAAVVALHTLLE
jgi:hypothetical protein